MGIASSRERDGHCGGLVPLHMDPKAYALSKVHGIPKKSKYLSMYPNYTNQMACENIHEYRRTGRPAHDIPKYHKILRGMQPVLFGKSMFGSSDPRLYVLTQVYKMRPQEISEVMANKYYTRSMALEELKHQHLRARNPGMKPFRYAMNHSIRFINTEHGFKYKAGREGYHHKYEYNPFKKFTLQKPTDPRKPKPTNYYVQQGIAEGKRLAQLQHSPQTPMSPSPFVFHGTTLTSPTPLFKFTPTAPPAPVSSSLGSQSQSHGSGPFGSFTMGSQSRNSHATLSRQSSAASSSGTSSGQHREFPPTMPSPPVSLSRASVSSTSGSSASSASRRSSASRGGVRGGVSKRRRRL